MKRKVVLILFLMLALFALTAYSAPEDEQTVDIATNGAAVKVVDDPKYEVGQYITFGTYPQTAAGNDNTPIEWLILARDGNKALLISKYALDSRAYNPDWTFITWEECSLRSWLNDDFLNKAFSNEEQAAILATNVTADKNPSFSTDPGNDTQDKVFLLSITEAEKYFKNDDARECMPTAYAVQQGANQSTSSSAKGNCWWWLRSPGRPQYFAAGVRNDGSVYHIGYSVFDVNCAVRPALWVNLGSDSETETQLPPVPDEKVSVEDYVTFGSYPQTEAGTDDTPIEWLILAREGNKALLISKYALDCQQYHTSLTEITWEECSLRSWLNDDFLNKVFSNEEQAAILITNVTADKNPYHSTYPGNDTQDKVFLLSIREAETYFKNNEARQCQPTDYADAQGVYTKNGICVWWLRSPGDYQSDAASVSGVGSVSHYGYFVNLDFDAVRPALWVNLDSGIF